MCLYINDLYSVDEKRMPPDGTAPNTYAYKSNGIDTVEKCKNEVLRLCPKPLT